MNEQKSEKQVKLKELAGDTNLEDEIKRVDEKLGEYIMLEKQYNETGIVVIRRKNEIEGF